MNSVLSDEVISVNAIYTPGTLIAVDESKGIFVLRIPNCDVSLRIQFPTDYPDKDSPRILGPESSGSETKKGEANEVVLLARDLLQTCFYQGEPCIYDLLEEAIPRLKHRYEEQEPHEEVHQSHSNITSEEQIDGAVYKSEVEQQLESLNPPWVLSEVVTEKKSIFVARAAQVLTINEAQLYLQHLVSTDRKVAKATHNISAWRIRESSSDAPVVYQDFDDDGETAAGGRLLHLLQLMDVWNVVVVVSRWYGGIHLGPDRFRIINSVARDAITRGKFLQSNDSGKVAARNKERK